MIKPVAMIFAVTVTLAPAAAVAAYSSAAGAPAPGGDFRLHNSRHRTRPIVGQAPRPRAPLPAISRNAEDCVETMCTCLAGGGC
jgi:hypothetical protein